MVCLAANYKQGIEKQLTRSVFDYLDFTFSYIYSPNSIGCPEFYAK
jgi:hypothetical protein